MFFGSLKSDRPGLGRRSSGFVSKRFPSWRQPKAPSNPQPEHGSEGASTRVPTLLKGGDPESLELDECVSEPRDSQTGPKLAARGLQAFMDRPRRRKSLGNVVQTVRAKLSRSDKSSVDFDASAWTKEAGPDQSHAFPEIKNVSDQPQNIQIKGTNIGKIKIPQLEVLGGLACGSLTNSSTFRDGLERAADDINTKYQNDPATVSRNSEICTQNRALERATRGYRRIFSSSATSSRRRNDRSSDVPPPHELAGSLVNSHSEPNPNNLYWDSHSTKVPLHWIEKILETSIPLRSPLDQSQPSGKEMDMDSKSLDIESASVIKHEVSSQPSSYIRVKKPSESEETVANVLVSPFSHSTAPTSEASVSGPPPEINTQDVQSAI